VPERDRLLLANHTTFRTRDIPIDDIANAINRQLEHFARGWGEQAWTIVRDLHRQGFRVVLRDHSTDPDSVADHFRLGGKPIASVYARDILESKDGSWTRGVNSVSAAVSHEVVEVLADPISLNYIDGLDDWMYALEVADPTQDDIYDIDGVAVSNFTYPDYWNPWGEKRRGHPLDHLGLVARPFEVRAGGYLVRYKGRRVNYVYGHKFAVRRRLVKETKPNGRTRRRLEQLAKFGDRKLALPPLAGTRKA